MHSVELFAGVGGLGLGVAAAGFSPRAVFEVDKECCSTIRANQSRGLAALRDWSLVESDVRRIDYRGYAGNLDLVSGGPPCQPFSPGGKQLGQRDKRDMFPEAIRAVRELRPKAFIFENVRGLTRAIFLNYFEYVRLQLAFPSIERIGGEKWISHHARLQEEYADGSQNPEYRVIVQCLNAADYGVPQKRERVFIVGIRSDLGIKWSFPSPTHSEDELLRAQRLTGDYWEKHKISRKCRLNAADSSIEGLKAKLEKATPGLSPWVTVRDAICDLPTPSLTANPFRHYRIPGARTYHGHTGSGIDEPSKTLKAGHHGIGGGENMLRNANGSVRYFTIRECARLQCFPDDYDFPGSWSSTTRQLGNAVPVLLGKIIAQSLYTALNRRTN